MRRGLLGLGIHDWHDLAPWVNSWDAADSEVVTYEDDGIDYSVDAATRVASIPDRGTDGSRPMAKDTGPYGTINGTLGGGYATDPLPGALWVAESARFDGRPAWYSDQLDATPSFFDGLYSGLFANLDPDDEFDVEQPWWSALLVSGGSETGNANVLLDGNPGASTIANEATINIQTWNNILDNGGTIDSGITPTAGKAVLLIWKVNGASSWFEVTRFTGGAIVTVRTAGTQGGLANGITTIHSGWSHSNYTSALAIGEGTPDEADVTRVRNWGSRILTAAG